MGLGVYLSFSSIRMITMLPSYGVQRFSALRISQSLSVKSGASIILTYKGCDTQYQLSQLRVEPLNSSIAMTMDGFKVSFSPLLDDEKLAPGIIEGSNDDWRTSQVAGSLNIRWNSNGVRFLPGLVPTQQNFEVKYFPPWPWFTYFLLDAIFMALLCFGAGLCGVMALPDLGRAITVSILVLLHLNAQVSAVGFACLGLARQTFRPSVDSAIYLAAACALRFAEARLIDAFTCLAALSLVADIVDDCTLFDDCPNLLDSPPVASAGFALLGALLAALRERFYRDLIRSAGPGQAAGDAAWESLAAAEPEALGRLAAACQALAQSAPPRHHDRARPRQLIRRLGRVLTDPRLSFDGGSLSAAFEGGVEGGPGGAAEGEDEWRPVNSLDQLYAQVYAFVRVHVRAHISGNVDTGSQACLRTHVTLDEDADFAGRIYVSFMSRPLKGTMLSCSSPPPPQNAFMHAHTHIQTYRRLASPGSLQRAAPSGRRFLAPSWTTGWCRQRRR